MTTPNNAARDRRRAEARILRAAREALLKEIDTLASATRPDIDRIAELTTKARKIEASLDRYAEKEKKPKPKADGRTQAERLKKEEMRSARAEMVRSLPMHEVLARIVARRRDIDPDQDANADLMKQIALETKSHLEKLPAKRLLNLPGDDA